MGVEVGWGRNSKPDASKSDFEKRLSWEVTDAAAHFYRLFKVPLLHFVGRVVTVLSPPQSTGLQFEFGPEMHDEFAKLIDQRAFPPKTLPDALTRTSNPQVVVPDDPGVQDRDAWWRRIAAGAAIGASFREEGTDTSLHIAFNKTICDVHVDRSGFIVADGGRVYWNLNNLLRHFTLDLAGDKAPWLLASFTVVRKNRPLVEATVGPWLAVDLPSKEGGDRTAVKVGLVVTGRF
jgi:hypothetical protein